MKLKALIINAKSSIHSTLDFSISLHQKAISEKYPTKTLSYNIWIYCSRYARVAFSKMKKGGPALRKELGDIKYLEAHPEVYQFFKDVGWYRFCEKIQGSHQQVVEAFSLSLDGSKAVIGKEECLIDENLILKWLNSLEQERSGLKPPYQRM